MDGGLTMRLRVKIFSLASLIIIGQALSAQSADWRVLVGGGPAVVIPAGDLYSGLDENVGWSAGFRVHRLQGFTRIGGLFGGGSIQGVNLAGNAISFLALEGGNAFPLGENGSHVYLLIGFDIYLNQREAIPSSGFVRDTSPGFGFKLQTGFGLLLTDRVGLDLFAAADFVSVRFTTQHAYSSNEEVKTSSLFSLGARLYFQVVDF
jgi:hypothetical protein